MKKKLEVIAFNLDCCMQIEDAGAQRIELCASPGDGGTTPSYGFIKEARKKVSIELFPIIRPRGGDFLYNFHEYEIMKSDITFCKNVGCDGIVIGMLHPDGTVDKKRVSALVELAYPMSVTFHRAFDRTSDPYLAVEEIIDIGCDRILTSGLKPTAIEGIANLESIIKKADERIIIMPGSGIRAANILEIATGTDAIEFHSSARKISGSKMKYLNKEMDEELKIIQVDHEEVLKMVQLINQK